MTEHADPFTAPDPAQTRQQREITALFRITERHANNEARRRWDDHGRPMGPFDAVQRITVLAGGSEQPEEGEPPVEDADVMAALTLAPRARAELDALEASLLEMAKGRGMTWQQIAFGLGLGTPQAARQRYERLVGRTAR
jgi:hypothetical protein